MGFIAHHLIEFTREALRGEQNASFYSAEAAASAVTAQRRCRTAQRMRKCALAQTSAYASVRARQVAGSSHGPKVAPFGSASCTIIISPMVSGVTSPTSRPLRIDDRDRGRRFLLQDAERVVEQRRWLIVGSVRASSRRRRGRRVRAP